MKQAEYEKVVASLACDVAITRDTVNQCMMNQTEIYVNYAMGYQRAVKHCKLLLFQLEQMEASIDRYLSARSSKVTEKMLRTACHGRDTWTQLKQELLEAEDRRDSLESIVRAMEHRKDMLVNYGATVREEERLNSGGVHVNKQSSRR
jgi:hypothetical protein